jgi:hypothetical protein
MAPLHVIEARALALSMRSTTKHKFSDRLAVLRSYLTYFTPDKQMICTKTFACYCRNKPTSITDSKRYAKHMAPRHFRFQHFKKQGNSNIASLNSLYFVLSY